MRINPVPWVVWGIASLVASLNTFASEGLSKQALIFGIGSLFFFAIVVRHWGSLKWEALPAWQKRALPLLLLSPCVSIFLSPLAGILLQSLFAWMTAATFIQTAYSGQSRDPVSAWVIETMGCLFLLLSNSFCTVSWILPLNSLLVSVACLTSILLAHHLHPPSSSTPAPGGS